MVLLLIVFTLIGNAANLVIPKIISYAIDSFSAGNFDWTKMVAGFLVATFIIFLFSYLQTIVQTYTAEKVAFDLRQRLSDKISAQNFAFIQKANPAKLLTNMTSDMDSVSGASLTRISPVEQNPGSWMNSDPYFSMPCWMIPSR